MQPVTIDDSLSLNPNRYHYPLSSFLVETFYCFSQQDGSNKMFDHVLIYLSFTFVLILGFILSFILSLTFFLILGLILGFVFGLALLLIFGFTLFFILSIVLGLTLFFINSIVLGLTFLLILSFVFGFTLFLVLCGTLLLKYDKQDFKRSELTTSKEDLLKEDLKP